MFLGIMEHKKKLQLVHFKSYPNHAPSHMLNRGDPPVTSIATNGTLVLGQTATYISISNTSAQKTEPFVIRLLEQLHDDIHPRTSPPVPPPKHPGLLHCHLLYKIHLTLGKHSLQHLYDLIIHTLDQ